MVSTAWDQAAKLGRCAQAGGVILHASVWPKLAPRAPSAAWEQACKWGSCVAHNRGAVGHEDAFIEGLRERVRDVLDRRDVFRRDDSALDELADEEVAPVD
eukprot:6483530-Prymnesium_polylepis.1